METLTQLGAMEAGERLQRGELRAEELSSACLQAIDAQENEIGAWVHVDRRHALQQAQMLDRYRRSGQPLGPLHGLPVGVKDIIDSADLPTENGTPLDAGRRPGKDATLVARLRGAGGVLLGKTVTTECAYLAPSKTRNPRSLEHTPGGSSSGSAAAVAANMVPLAIGTQTGGSVIRPAAFCGVIGFKPSFGLIPRSGVLLQCRWLDTIGVFARSVADTALLADALAGHDPGDPDTQPSAAPRILETALNEPPVTPALAFVKTPAWTQIEPDCAAGFAELLEVLGEHCDEIQLPEVFAQAAPAHRRVMVVEIAKNLRHYYDRGREQLAPETRSAIEEGRSVSGVDYLSALDWRGVLGAGLEEIFHRYDALITPATPGEAPRGFATTGNPAFCTLWTFTGVPAITLPLLEGANGLPIGVQLIGRRGHDGRLLRTARWLMKTLGHEA